ncbi:hypothetical protein F2P79_008024 [Pimephales promelas]|nr:hypothetical protein F2P79_008024 [Pimephales promelas]
MERQSVNRARHSGGEGFSTYYRMCSNCGLKYRYQEWTDGLRNFDDHLLMSSHVSCPAPFTPDSSCH